MITTQNLIFGYQNGIFPMAEPETGEIHWYSPDPRAIIPLDTYKCQKSLRPFINKGVFDIKINHDFEATIRSCAKQRSEKDETWISEKIIKVYCELFEMGYAHSIEAYYENTLVGGLYGVSMGKVFFGESMFFTMPNASKVAFHYLIELLKSKNFQLLDTQFINDNVKRFGAIEISKSDFMNLLRKNIGTA